MFNFYDKFIELCAERGVKPTPVLKAINISPGNLKRWESGASITVDTLGKILDYFNVSPDYFFESNKIMSDDKQFVPVIDTMTAFKLFTESFKKQYGEDSTLEAGNTVIVIFNNCAMLVSVDENNHMTTNFIDGKPLEINVKLNLFTNEK
ncbi:MAG: helix-turn-helix transcriptional regulator [Oscillospiraceae bacterium]|nr:helix-turn-helix transcriptional regulator [Oscillospiraceae bacterium]